MKKCCTLLLIVVSLTTSARTFDPGELQDEVAFLCSPRFCGRPYGSPGCKSVAAYIADEFVRAGLQLKCQSDSEQGFNVIGYLPATRDERPDIVISAYYDGIGSNASGEICPGADANISGVVALLELARAFAGTPMRSYNLVFVALDGHNAGLTGGKAYAEKYYDRTALMISLDTMGSTLSPVSLWRRDYLLALGADRWRRTLEKVNSQTSMLDLYYDYYGSKSFTRLFFESRSSHRYMLEHGVPCVMFTSGITLNTNHPSDNEKSLDYGVFARRILLIENWISTFDKTKNN